MGREPAAQHLCGSGWSARNWGTCLSGRWNARTPDRDADASARHPRIPGGGTAGQWYAGISSARNNAESRCAEFLATAANGRGRTNAGTAGLSRGSAVLKWANSLVKIAMFSRIGCLVYRAHGATLCRIKVTLRMRKRALRRWRRKVSCLQVQRLGLTRKRIEFSEKENKL